MFASLGDSALFTRRRKLLLLLAAGMYLAAAVVVYFTIDQAAIDRVFALPGSVLAIMLGLSLLNYAIRAWRWIYLSRRLDLRVPIGSNCLYYFAGYALTATPGKAGEAVRLWLLKTGHAVAYSRSLPLMLADRIVDMWSISVLVLLSMSGFAAYHWQSVAMALFVMAISVPVLFPKLLLPVVGLLYRWLRKHGRLLVRARRVINSMSSALDARAYGITLLPTVIGWFAEGAALYLVLAQFGVTVSLANAVFVFSFSMIVGALSMLPGGLGSTEATMVILLNVLGVDVDTALAATAIVRITTFWFAVLLGLVSAPLAADAAKRSSQLLVPQVNRSN